MDDHTEALFDPSCAAYCFAATFDASDPCGSLARLGVRLEVRRESLRLPGKRVHGAWDPLLQRIELFGCDASRTNEAIVGTLGHEVWHAVGRRNTAEDGEEAAQRFARLWMDQLGAAQIARCAAALRAMAGTDAGPARNVSGSTAEPEAGANNARLNMVSVRP
jgi:hypothetical protein